MDLSVGTCQAEGAINHTPLMIGDRKITESIIMVTQMGIPRPELMDGQGPIILSDIKLLPPLRPREGKSGQGTEGPNIQQQSGLEVGPKELGSV